MLQPLSNQHKFSLKSLFWTTHDQWGWIASVIHNDQSNFSKTVMNRTQIQKYFDNTYLVQKLLQSKLGGSQMGWSYNGEDL